METINNIKIPIKLHKIDEDQSCTRQNEQITIPKTRTRKADENFWKRASYLLNLIQKVGKVDREQIDKNTSQICTGITLTKSILRSICVPGRSTAAVEIATQCRKSAQPSHEV